MFDKKVPLITMFYHRFHFPEGNNEELFKQREIEYKMMGMELCLGTASEGPWIIREVTSLRTLGPFIQLSSCFA